MGIINGRGSEYAPLFVLCGHPNAQADLDGRPLAGTLGEYFFKVVEKSGFTEADLYITYLYKSFPKEKKSNRDEVFDELNRIKPNAILALGLGPAKFVFGFKKNIFSKLLGRFLVVNLDYGNNPLVVCWHDIEKLYLGGKKTEKQTVNILKEIKAITC